MKEPNPPVTASQVIERRDICKAGGGGHLTDAPGCQSAALGSAAEATMRGGEFRAFH